MELIVAYIDWIMLVSGLLTTTMIFAAIAPKAALRSNFGETLEGPLAEAIVRNWGALIALVGAMLIYGAYHAEVRPLVLAVGIVSKLFFIALVVSQGGRWLRHGAGVAVVVDLIMVALFAAYLVATRGP